MRRIEDVKKFKTSLPYASEIFGIYQPLLGWKSKRIENRIAIGFYLDNIQVLFKIYRFFEGTFQADLRNGEIKKIEIGKLMGPSRNFNTFLLNEVAKRLPDETKITNKIWDNLITKTNINSVLDTAVKDKIHHWIRNLELTNIPSRYDISTIKAQMLEKKINVESIIGGALLEMVNRKQYHLLKQIFYETKGGKNLSSLLQAMKYKDPFDYMDPKKDLDRVGLSPIGIVHLFRQYFYEFDTFLGTPVGHIWLSPGSTVELIEISTRKTITERTTEFESEEVVKSETSLTEQDEISDAIKEDNKSEVKFGANVSAKQSWIWGSASQSASFDMNTTQQTAREQTHKHMRQQSEKLSTEIRKNYKSTFKTITEYTDTTSKRYVLNNSTEDLINYELRRKMRQVGVQVQDIGTYLCWQTYVDEPGRDLGVANLVHIAKTDSIDDISHPEEIASPKPFAEKKQLQIPFVPDKNSNNPADQKDISYTNGAETDIANECDDTEYIEYQFPRKVVCKKSNYYLDDVKLESKGSEVKASVIDFAVNKNTNEATFTVNLDYVHFHEQNFVNIEATLYWKPMDKLITEIADENKKRLALYTERIEAEYKNEYIEAARERIKLASNIKPRKYEELREEERIVVYRHLIQDMLAPQSKISQPNDSTRHIVSELINSIFDVDKMLYFVAPEWWKPRETYAQQFGIMIPKTDKDGKPIIGLDGKPEMEPDLTQTLSEENSIGWGGVNEMRRDNYYITEDSVPAKLGSSLGWLLQLDGDNMRNAFLNAPWVKAVIPIRPGKEKAAINWLKQVEGMNGITNNDIYTGTEPNLQGKTMLQVLDLLAEKVKQKHLDAIKTSIADPENPGDPENTVTATPVDKVYEHGFYPLKDGFKAQVGEDFEVFDQWIEVLPTDQVVAVEVKYDPKTGRQI